MVFNLEDMKDDKTAVMICRTADEAAEFCEFLTNHGRRWCNGKSYTENNSFESERGGSGYLFNIGKYGSVEYFKTHRDFHFMEFSKFEWPSTSVVHDIPMMTSFLSSFGGE